mgnify:FL=1
MSVKANRLFAGYEHEQQVHKLAEHFAKPVDYYKQVNYNPGVIKILKENSYFSNITNQFTPLNAGAFATYDEAYHQLMINIIEKQVISTKMVLRGTDVKRIFVDGGFSKNSIFMNLMAQVFSDVEVFAASMAQATAMGAALEIGRT